MRHFFRRQPEIYEELTPLSLSAFMIDSIFDFSLVGLLCSGRHVAVRTPSRYPSPEPRGFWDSSGDQAVNVAVWILFD